MFFFVMVAGLIVSSFYWGSPGHSWNMRQVRGEIQKLNEKLEGDTRFSEVKFLVSTANMGKNLNVDGVAERCWFSRSLGCARDDGGGGYGDEAGWF